MIRLTEADRRFMKMALRLARRGRGSVSPNPMVGCVVVRRGRVVGRGWHRYFGSPHAEIEALRNAGDRARGSTIYVTLEPCAHSGKTPPCTEAILAAGVTRVVAAAKDPNPTVCGGGAEWLAGKGLSVHVGLLEKESSRLNRGFETWARAGRPYVTLKLAASLDGRIATRTGDSKWITAVDARKRAHGLRAEHDAVVVGAATVTADDPALTVRLGRGRNPARIVLDGRLASPCPAEWLEDDGIRRIVVTTPRAPAARRREFAETGAEVWIVPADRRGGVRLPAFLRAAAEEGFLSLLVEGGGRLAASFLASDSVDRLELFFSAILLGGQGRGWTEALRVAQVADAPRLRSATVRRVGGDWWFSGDLARDNRREANGGWRRTRAGRIATESEHADHDSFNRGGGRRQP